MINFDLISSVNQVNSIMSLRSFDNTTDLTMLKSYLLFSPSMLKFYSQVYDRILDLEVETLFKLWFVR